MIGPLIEWPFSLLIPFRTVKYEAAWRSFLLPYRSTGFGEYVSHIFIIMSNVWQRLLMSAWLLPKQWCRGARYSAPTGEELVRWEPTPAPDASTELQLPIADPTGETTIFAAPYRTPGPVNRLDLRRISFHNARTYCGGILGLARDRGICSLYPSPRDIVERSIIYGCATKRGDGMCEKHLRLYRQAMSRWGVASRGCTLEVK